MGQTVHDVVYTEFKAMGQGNVVGAFEQIGRASSLMVVAASGVGVLAGATMALGIAGVKAAANLEVLQMRLNSIFGGASGGQAAMEWAKQFQQQTGLGLSTVIDSVARMQALGLDFRNMLGPIADTAAALGLQGDGIQRIVLQLGQMKTQQQVTREDLKILAEAGVPVFDILREKMGLTGDQLRKIGEIGLDVDVVLKKLTEGLQERFGGGLKLYGETLSGSFDKLKNNIFLILGAIGDGINPALKDAVQSMEKMTKSADGLQRLTDNVQRLVTWLQLAFTEIRLGLLESSKVVHNIQYRLAAAIQGSAEAMGKFANILPWGEKLEKLNADGRARLEEMRKGMAARDDEIKRLEGRAYELRDKMRDIGTGKKETPPPAAQTTQPAAPQASTQGAFQKYVEAVLIGGAERARRTATGMRGALGIGGLGPSAVPTIRIQMDTRDSSPLMKAIVDIFKQEFPKTWRQVLGDPRVQQMLRRWLTEGA